MPEVIASDVEAVIYYGSSRYPVTLDISDVPTPDQPPLLIAAKLLGVMANRAGGGFHSSMAENVTLRHNEERYALHGNGWSVDYNMTEWNNQLMKYCEAGNGPAVLAHCNTMQHYEFTSYEVITAWERMV